MIMLASKAKRVVTPRSRAARGLPVRSSAAVVREAKYRFLPLTDAGKHKRIQFKIYGEPMPFHSPRLSRGLYLSQHAKVEGAVDVFGVYVLADGHDAVVAMVSPVPLGDAVYGTPSRLNWPELQRVATEILDDGGEPVSYLGLVPYPGVPSHLTGPTDPMVEFPLPRAPKPVPALGDVLVRHAMLPIGLHIAPFFGEKGEILIAAIGQDGGLDALMPVEEIGTWALRVQRTELPAHVAYSGTGPEFAHDCTVDDRGIASTFVRDYVERGITCRYEPLIHVCPWRGRVKRSAHMVVVTNSFGCAISFAEVDHLNAPWLNSELHLVRDMRADADAGADEHMGRVYHPKARERMAADRERKQPEAAADG